MNGEKGILFTQGNEACVRGALYAGLRFFAGYPITPSTEVAELLSEELPHVGGRFIQMEDEISSLCAVCAASVAGDKAMTATSGPGFSLMQEALGYAIMGEIPCVVTSVQRGGPSTGLPTKVAQGDVPSIDHETLKQKFRRKYKDPELLELIDEVIDSISTCPATDENIEFYRSCGNEIKIVKVNGKDFIEGVGIPIGNYFSQYDGNFFLSGFDHWIKEVKRVKHYYRYMDDICIFARTKEELHQLLAEINEYFIQNLKLRIKGNYQIFPSFIRGIDFVGYRIFLKDTLLRKSTCQEFERKMTAIRKKIESGQEMNYSEWCAINSYKGWLKYCDSSRLSEKYIEPIQPYADRYYKDHIKKGGKKHEKVRKSTQYKAA